MKRQEASIQTEQTIILGLSKRRLGKTTARNNFLPLCDELKDGNLLVEVTERNEPAIVMLSKDRFDAMTRKLEELLKPQYKKHPLLGSVTIIKDLEKASRSITADFEKSVKRTAASL